MGECQGECESVARSFLLIFLVGVVLVISRQNSYTCITCLVVTWCCPRHVSNLQSVCQPQSWNREPVSCHTCTRSQVWWSSLYLVYTLHQSSYSEPDQTNCLNLDVVRVIVIWPGSRTTDNVWLCRNQAEDEVHNKYPWFWQPSPGFQTRTCSQRPGFPAWGLTWQVQWKLDWDFLQPRTCWSSWPGCWACSCTQQLHDPLPEDVAEALFLRWSRNWFYQSQKRL